LKPLIPPPDKVVVEEKPMKGEFKPVSLVEEDTFIDATAVVPM